MCSTRLNVGLTYSWAWSKANMADASAHTEERTGDAPFASAGVLPFACCPTDPGSIFFLLGQEQNIPGYHNSATWSAFEGGRRGAETGAETAAREFAEESMSCIPVLPQGVALNEGAVCQALQRNDYTMCVTLDVVPSKPGSTARTRRHILYVKQIPFWKPSIAEDFADTRSALLSLRDACLKAEAARKAAPQHSPYLCEGTPVTTDDGKAAVVSAVRSVLIAEDGSMRICFECVVHGEDSRVLRTGALTATNVPPSFRAAIQARETMLRTLSTLPEHLKAHPALRLTKDSTGAVVWARVCPDFLEKQKIGWWGTERLRHVVDRAGTYKHHAFRASFVPMLAKVLDTLDTAHYESIAMSWRRAN